MISFGIIIALFSPSFLFYPFLFSPFLNLGFGGNGRRWTAVFLNVVWLACHFVHFGYESVPLRGSPVSIFVNNFCQCRGERAWQNHIIYAYLNTHLERWTVAVCELTRALLSVCLCRYACVLVCPSPRWYLTVLQRPVSVNLLDRMLEKNESV